MPLEIALPEEQTLIKAARLYDGAAEHCDAHCYVTLSGDSITDMGASADLGTSAAEQFDQVIELNDEVTLMPGLINMHTHLTFSALPSVYDDALQDSDTTKTIRMIEALRAATDCGITTVRDCGTWPHLILPTKDAVESGLLPGPRIVASGAITTTGGHCYFCATEADNEDEVRKAVRSHVKSGVDFIKLFATGGNTTPGSNALIAQYTEAEMCAAADEARKAGRRTASHAHALEGVRTSIAARVTTIEHCSFQMPDGFGWDDEMVSEIIDAGIYVCPTVFRGIAKFEGDPSYTFSERERMILGRRRERFALTERLADRGVMLVSGNDCGVTHSLMSDYPLDLVETAEKCHISARDVVRSATSVAADALGRPELGRIQAGAAADLLVVEGDPLADIHAVTRPRTVIGRGRVLRQHSLQH